MLFENEDGPDADDMHRLERSHKLIEFPPGMDSRARRYAKQYADQLDREEKWCPGFEAGVSQLAQLLIEIGDLQIAIRRDGRSLKTEKNQTAKNVDLSTLNQCRTQLAVLLTKFKLTPSSATIEEKQKKNPLAELAAKRGVTVPGMDGHTGTATDKA